MDSKLGIKKWIAFLVAGFVGQLAWAIENNYLNLYAFYCTRDYIYIPLMTAFSALTATVVTLLMGTLSDRLGKRKIFISLGYIIWGISIILFAFLDPKNNITIVNNSVVLAGCLIVIQDCIMTFFGSTANDAAFNASVTENTNPLNRGKVESVLSILPLLAMIAVVVVGGIFVDGDEKHWDIFFYLFGGITILAGIACLFIYPKDIANPTRNEAYFSNIFHGFKPRVIKENKLLYLSLSVFLLFSIGIQVFMPYLMVYIQEGLEIRGGDFTIAIAVVLVVSSILVVVVGLFMDKIGKNKIIFPALAMAVIGGIIMTFVKKGDGVMIGTMIGCTILMTGYLICTAVFGAKVRDYTPVEKAGLFQGIRMIFVVLIPMVTGPYIGRAASYINAETYTNEYDQVVTKPNSFIFLFAAIVIALAIIPLIILIKKEKAHEQATTE